MLKWALKNRKKTIFMVILVFVLADMMEQNLLQSIKINGGLGGILESPIALGFMVAAVVVLLGSLIAEFKNKKSTLLTADE